MLIQVIHVTLVYGCLVEYFPARIRYTSMSVPYHMGNGWFGGLTPETNKTKIWDEVGGQPAGALAGGGRE